MPTTTQPEIGPGVAMAPKRIKVLIVDDSAVVRQVLTALFQSDATLEVVAAVADPILAIERMKLSWRHGSTASA